MWTCNVSNRSYVDEGCLEAGEIQEIAEVCARSINWGWIQFSDSSTLHCTICPSDVPVTIIWPLHSVVKWVIRLVGAWLPHKTIGTTKPDRSGADIQQFVGNGIRVEELEVKLNIKWMNKTDGCSHGLHYFFRFIINYVGNLKNVPKIIEQKQR